MNAMPFSGIGGPGSGFIGQMIAKARAASAAKADGSIWGNVDPTQVRDEMMSGMGDYQTGFENLGNQFGSKAASAFRTAGKYGGQAQQLMSGRGPILQAMRQQMSQGLGDQASQQSAQQNAALAARGMGGGGLSNILGRGNLAQAGESYAQGLVGVQKYGLDAGKAFGDLQAQMMGQGSNLLSGQGQAIGSAGQIQSQGNQAYVSQLQANATNKANYLQGEAARKRAAKAKRRSGFGGLIGGLAGAAIGTAFGNPVMGAQMGSSFGSSF